VSDEEELAPGDIDLYCTSEGSEADPAERRWEDKGDWISSHTARLMDVETEWQKVNAEYGITGDWKDPESAAESDGEPATAEENTNAEKKRKRRVIGECSALIKQAEDLEREAEVLRGRAHRKIVGGGFTGDTLELLRRMFPEPPVKQFTPDSMPLEPPPRPASPTPESSGETATSGRKHHFPGQFIIADPNETWAPFRREINGVPNYFCPVPGCRMPRKTSWTQTNAHILVDHLQRKFECDLCGKSWVQKRSLASHKCKGKKSGSGKRKGSNAE